MGMREVPHKLTKGIDAYAAIKFIFVEYLVTDTFLVLFVKWLNL